MSKENLSFNQLCLLTALELQVAERVIDSENPDEFASQCQT